MTEDEQVVLTCKYKSISILRYSTKTNHWYELSGNWWWSANMVTAWQPLPDPYQPLSNDSTDAGTRYEKSAWRDLILRNFMRGSDA